MYRYRIAVATFPWNGVISWRTSDWCMKTVLKMKRNPRIERIYPIYQTGSFPINMLRNRAACAAVENGCDYLLMIDNDMAPDVPEDGSPFWETAWEFMMGRRDGGLSPAVVAAPYLCNAGGDFYSTDWKDPNDPSRVGFDDLVPIDKEDAFSRRGIKPVATTQTGLILYDIRVFETVPPPWFTFEWQDRAQFFMLASEDHYNTRKCNAYGCPVFMAWDSWAGHMKTLYVTRDLPGEEFARV